MFTLQVALSVCELFMRPRYNDVETIQEAIECLGWFDSSSDSPDINCVEGQSTDRYTTPVCIQPEKKSFENKQWLVQPIPISLFH